MEKKEVDLGIGDKDPNEVLVMRKLTFAESFMLGGIAAGISKTVAAPIERVKLLLQNQDEMIKAGRLDKPYGGIWDCADKVMKNEGFIHFWRGNVANVVRYFPTQALNFAFKEQLNKMFKTSDKDMQVVRFGKLIAAGGIGSSISLSMVYSLDYARTRLANDALKEGSQRQFSGLLDVYKKSYQWEGMRGMYRGFAVSVVGIFVYRGFYFGLYDGMKPIVLNNDAGFFAHFALGYSTTIAATLISYPFDTVRRRLMMTTGEAVKYQNSYDLLKQIVQQEGAQSLFKGGFSNIVRAMACAGVLAGYDWMERVYLYFVG